MNSSGRKAIVVGGGIAGLASAIALQKSGWNVTIYERAQTIVPMGAALSLWPNAVEGLRQLEVLDSLLPQCEPITSMLVADSAGRAIIGPHPMRSLAVMVTRSNLQETLLYEATASKLVLGKKVSEIASCNRKASVSFEDGSSDDGDIVIDAAGIRSIGSDEQQVTYRGYSGVLALSQPTENISLRGIAAEFWGNNERFGVFPLRAGRRYWFHMLTRPEGSGVLTKREIHMRSKSFPGVVGETVEATNEADLIPFSIYAAAPPRRLGEGQVVRVGDAAHAMEPNLGQGACQGIEDAAALLALAGLPSHEIVARFEDLRLARVRTIVARAAEGKLGAHANGLVRWSMRTALRSIPNGLSTRLTRRIQTMPDYASEVRAGTRLQITEPSV